MEYSQIRLDDFAQVTDRLSRAILSVEETTKFHLDFARDYMDEYFDQILAFKNSFSVAYPPLSDLLDYAEANLLAAEKGGADISEQKDRLRNLRSYNLSMCI